MRNGRRVGSPADLVITSHEREERVEHVVYDLLRFSRENVRRLCSEYIFVLPCESYLVWRLAGGCWC